MIELNKIYCGDCLELMKQMESSSVDMILADVPYGTTACKWDTIIPFEPMWEQVKRIIKPNGAIVMTASQPFTSKMVMSNLKMFRHQWVWDKKQSGNPFLAKLAPLKTFEDVIVFSINKVNYIPQMRKGRLRNKGGAKVDSRITGTKANQYKTFNDDYYPSAIIEFSIAGEKGRTVHPTQKPVALFEYLIRTYTNEGDTVLDFVIGSGTTAIACIKTGRQFIGMELSPEYCTIANKRIGYELQQTKLEI